jgi:hypothetical protein
MKKISLILSFVAALGCSTTFFSSCKTAETTAPVLSLSEDTKTVNPGQVVSITATINSDANATLKELKVTKSTGSISAVKETRSLSGTSFTYIFSDTVDAAAVNGQVFTYTFLVTDNKDKTVEKVLTLTVSVVNYKAITELSTVFTLDNEWSGNQFFTFSPSSMAPAEMSIAQAHTYSELVDFCYGSRNVSSGANNIAAPSSGDAKAVYDKAGPDKISNWSTINTMDFVKTALSVSDYNAATTDQKAQEAFASGTVTNSVTNLNGGEVIAFRLKRINRVGLIYIMSASGDFETTKAGQCKFKAKITQ